jgi:hypothetical protein
MKKRIRLHFSLGMQMRQRHPVDDVIQHLTEQKNHILNQGYDAVLIEMLDAVDSDDGMARLMLIGERDETDKEEQSRTKKEQRHQAFQQEAAKLRTQEEVMEFLTGMTKEAAEKFWAQVRRYQEGKEQS